MALQGGTLLAFSIGSATTTYGILQSVDITEKVNRAKAIAPDGNIVSIQEFGEETSLNLTYVELSAASTTDNPHVGAKFTFESNVYQIDSVSSVRTIDGFKTVTAEASRYEGIF